MSADVQYAELCRLYKAWPTRARQLAVFSYSDDRSPVLPRRNLRPTLVVQPAPRAGVDTEEYSTAARSIVALTLSFGLVSIPVRVYSATEASAAVKFNLLTKEGSHVKQQYVSEKNGKTVVIEGH